MNKTWCTGVDLFNMSSLDGPPIQNQSQRSSCQWCLSTHWWKTSLLPLWWMLTEREVGEISWRKFAFAIIRAAAMMQRCIQGVKLSLKSKTRMCLHSLSFWECAFGVLCMTDSFLNFSSNVCVLSMCCSERLYACSRNNTCFTGSSFTTVYGHLFIAVVKQCYRQQQ